MMDITEGLFRVYSSDNQMSVLKKCIFLQYAGLKMKRRQRTFISHVVCIKQSNNTNADLPCR